MSDRKNALRNFLRVAIQDELRRMIPELLQEFLSDSIDLPSSDDEVRSDGFEKLSAEVPLFRSSKDSSNVRRPRMAAQYGVDIGQKWKSKIARTKGRVIEIVALEPKVIVPNVISGAHGVPRSANKRIQYRFLVRNYELVRD